MIYLDNNSTTKPFQEVVESMTQFMTSRYWNATSAYGQLDGLEEIIDSAKGSIRKLIGAAPEDEVVFTSGATESNVWAIAEGARRVVGGRGWVLSSQIEHPSVLESLKNIQEQGLDVRYLPVTRNGTIDLNKLATIVDPSLCFASLMFAHNETGVIQPLGEATVLIRERAPQCLIHTDATQAIGKMSLSFSGDLSEVDLVSFSGHKFHGPKGIGGLVIRNGTQLKPLIRGGGQQNNFRSGTLNLPAIAGISVAAKKCLELLQSNQNVCVRAVRDHFEKRISLLFDNVYILGSQAPRLPNTCFFGIPATDADDIVHALSAQGVAISKGSSCSAQSIQPPMVALLMDYTYDEASSLFRFSASFENNNEEVDVFVEKLHELLYTGNKNIPEMEN